MQPDNSSSLPPVVPVTSESFNQTSEQIPASQPTQNPSLPATQPQPTPVGMQYAGVWTRFWAICIDGVILGILSTIVNIVNGVINAASAASGSINPVAVAISLILGLLLFVVEIAYPIYFIGSRGQTPGKMIMKVKVVMADTGMIPGYGSAFMREIIGKLVSGMVFGIGYFVAFGDAKHQAWHDRIAKTVVVKA